MALIDVRNVTKIFGSNPKSALQRLAQGADKDTLLAETGHTLGLHDVSISVERGEVFVVMGLSGSGKSTLIRHLNRLIDPTVGSILIDGVDVLSLSLRKLNKLRRDKMSMVFQRFALMPHRTVLDNIAYGLEVQRVAAAERRARAQTWVEMVELTGYEKQYPVQLSGGMQQRVGLARALCTDPEILLMDEAFSALDPLIRTQMQDQLIAIQSRLHKTIVFITHDLDEALRLGDRIAILKDGVLSQVGTPAQILLQPADDYVRAFVRDVNRARVLKAGSCAEQPALQLRDETRSEALAAMDRAGTDIGYVSGAAGYRGTVTRAALLAAAGAAPDQSIHPHIVELPAVTIDQSLSAALRPALAGEHPVPVVDDNGDLHGVLSRDRIGEILSPDERKSGNPSDEDN
ncbi:MAG: quaternary amine ABC transporter ATP-binding protein [Alphaproteobacteria bacterium]